MKDFVVVALFTCVANAAVLLPVQEDEEMEKGLPAFRLDPDDSDDVLLKALPELRDVTSKQNILHSKRDSKLLTIGIIKTFITFMNNFY